MYIMLCKQFVYLATQLHRNIWCGFNSCLVHSRRNYRLSTLMRCRFIVEVSYCRPTADVGHCIVHGKTE